jgi:hypothetical protein
MALVRVHTKARKHSASVPTDYEIEHGANGSITIYKGGKQGSTFSVGDTAEYDSYNLSYTGKISKISEKAVTIVAYPGTRNEKVHRLDLNTFCWRNHKFTVEAAQKANNEWSMHS